MNDRVGIIAIVSWLNDDNVGSTIAHEREDRAVAIAIVVEKAVWRDRIVVHYAIAISTSCPAPATVRHLGMKTRAFTVAALSRVLSLLVGMLGFPFVALAQMPTLEPIRAIVLPILVSQVVGHPDGQHLLMVEHAGKRVVKVALGDGQLVASYEFPHRIGRIALTPDGRHLYAGLVILPAC